VNKTNSLAARSPRGTTPARILPASGDAPHPSRLRTTSIVALVWKQSGWPSEVTASAVAQVWSRRARMQRGAESPKAKGCSKKRECESVTTARGENPF
jgi:hypothetical protein